MQCDSILTFPLSETMCIDEVRFASPALRHTSSSTLGGIRVVNVDGDSLRT